ncbi:hypothetical protein LCGC14_1141270 [marine sediment metagenome]|uniref:Uncharacterized protein n=1 Tax=marine sediment metagenome TaxID=412755 RepID=A0A0F9M304_9ZZZZ
MPLTPDEQEALDERFEALEDRNERLERLIRSGRAFTTNPLALATDLDDLGSVKTHLDFEEAPLTPIDPPADVIRMYAKEFSGLSTLFYKDDAGHEVQVSDKLWTNFPIYGPTASSQWKQESVTGGSVVNAFINRLDLRPSSGLVVCVADNNNWSPFPGDGSSVIDWSRRVVFKFRFSMVSASSTTINLMQFGRSVTPGFTDLSGKGIGIRLDNLVMIGEIHDGSSRTTTGTLANLSTSIGYEMLIVSRGDGTVEWFLNGSSVGTSSGGPSSAGTAGDSVPVFSCRDTASTNGRMLINQCDVLVQ